MYLILHALFGVQRIPTMNVTPMKVPKHIDKTGSEGREPEKFVGDEMYQAIQHYKRQMDSLRIPIRPGLLDSMRVLEQIYQSQN